MTSASTSPPPAVVDFFYGTRRIAELRWSAREEDRASCDVSWDLVMIHFTGEEAGTPR